MDKLYFDEQELMEGYADVYELNQALAEEAFNVEVEVDRIINENLEGTEMTVAVEAKEVYVAIYNHRIAEDGVEEYTWLVASNVDYIKQYTNNFQLATLDEVNEYVKQCDPCAWGELIYVVEGIAKWNSRIEVLEELDRNIEFETGEYVLVK